MSYTEQSVKQDFERDTAKHVIQILHDDGVYRHVTFRGRSAYADMFQVTTWPGHLCISGAHGTYVFSRMSDMFEFFRGAYVNLPYWAETCLAVDKQSGMKEYCPERAQQHTDDALFGYDGEDVEGLEACLDEDVYPYLGDGEDAARRAIDEFHFRGRRLFTDTFEWDLQRYTYHYIWCCHAIQWGIQQYDNLKVVK